MKSYLFAWMLALAAILIGAGVCQAAPKRVKGSGKLVTKTVQVPEFQAVQAARAVDVQLVAEKGRKLTIEADDNVLPYVVAEVKEGVLHLTIDKALRTLNSVHVKITVPTDGRLRALNASSAAQITSNVRICGEKVVCKASSAAEIDVKIEAAQTEFDLSSAANITAEVVGRNCSIEASSSADFKGMLAVQGCEVEASSAAHVKLAGAALACEADLSSAADLNATKLAVKNCKVSASSGADVRICCLEELYAEASSGADITYTGDCVVRRHKSSSGGSIQHR